jgi:hypothetical protein
MEFVKERKGRGWKYVCENMIFSQYGIKKGVPYLACDYSVGNTKCEGRAKLVDEKLILTAEHTHNETMTREIEKLQLTNRCRKRAAEVRSDSLRAIFDAETRTVSQPVSASISFTELESSMYKRRRLVLPALPESADLAATCVRESEYANVDDAPFFQGDVNSPDGGIALIFATRAQMEQLSTAHEIFVDGTFRTVPRLFFQLFTLFASVQSVVFPMVFVLMTNKTTALYRAVMQKIHELVPTFSPVRVMGDFEEASIRSITDVFGDQVVLSGCWFHFAQAIVRRARRIGLTIAFKHDAIARKCIRSLCALPLLPPEAIPGAAADIRTVASAAQGEVLQKLETLCEYVRKTWIEKATIGPERLSVAARSDRTNNGVESFHSAFAKRVKVSHPNFYMFLSHVRNAAKDTMSEINRLAAGHAIRRPKKKAYVQSDIRVRNAMRRLANGECTNLEFLFSISHCSDTVTAVLEAPSGTESENVLDTSSAHEDPQDPVAESDDEVNEALVCTVCRVNQRSNLALVPCGHARFCRPCADTLQQGHLHCPLCRADIQAVMTIFT